MSNAPFADSIPSNILEQTVADVARTVTQAETALADIVAWEREIIRKAKNDAANLEEFVTLNESVNITLREIAKVERMIRLQLRLLNELVAQLKNHEAQDACAAEP